MEAPVPGVYGRLDGGLRFVDIVQSASELITQLMTKIAARFQGVDPVVLGQHGCADAVPLSSGARKQALGRWLHEGQPGVAWINLRRFLRSLGRSRFERYRIRSWFHLDLRRIDETVSSYPNTVIGVWQFGQHEPALIIRDHNLDEIRKQILCLGDDPHAGLRTLAALDHAGDVALCRRRSSLLHCTAGVSGKSSNQSNQPYAKQRPHITPPQD